MIDWEIKVFIASLMLKQVEDGFEEWLSAYSCV